MTYEHVKEGVFLCRPNRFIAHVLLDGRQEICHVKNTGRCRELLIPGAVVYLNQAEKENRKTKFDLIAVRKAERLINVDSQAPNRAVGEWLEQGGLFPKLWQIRPEYRWGASRFDFMAEASFAENREERKKVLIEVKGVTLEEEGIVLFPDAPTQRGVKHVYELCEAASQGWETYLLFVIQMQQVRYFTPNRKTHAAFGEALRHAKESGVHILAYDCLVAPDSIKINDPVKVIL